MQRTLICGASFLMACVSTAEADTTIDYSWTEVKTELLNREITRQERIFTLRLFGKSINVISYGSGAGRNFYEVHGKLKSTIGAKDELGNRYVIRYELTNNTIVEFKKVSGGLSTTKIETDGTDSCNVSNINNLSPSNDGFTIIRDDSVKVKYSEIITENTKCRISNLPR